MEKERCLALLYSKHRSPFETTYSALLEEPPRVRLALSSTSSCVGDGVAGVLAIWNWRRASGLRPSADRTRAAFTHSLKELADLGSGSVRSSIWIGSPRSVWWSSRTPGLHPRSVPSRPRLSDRNLGRPPWPMSPSCRPSAALRYGALGLPCSGTPGSGPVCPPAPGHQRQL